MSITTYDLTILHSKCVASNCLQAAYVSKRDWQQPFPASCGADGLLAGIRARQDGDATELRPLEAALTACAESCRQRLAACRAKDLEALRSINVVALQRAAKVRNEMRRFL